MKSKAAPPCSIFGNGRRVLSQRRQHFHRTARNRIHIPKIFPEWGFLTAFGWVSGSLAWYFNDFRGWGQKLFERVGEIHNRRKPPMVHHQFLAWGQPVRYEAGRCLLCSPPDASPRNFWMFFGGWGRKKRKISTDSQIGMHNPISPHFCHFGGDESRTSTPLSHGQIRRS